MEKAFRAFVREQALNNMELGSVVAGELKGLATSIDEKFQQMELVQSKTSHEVRLLGKRVSTLEDI